MNKSQVQSQISDAYGTRIIMYVMDGAGWLAFGAGLNDWDLIWLAWCGLITLITNTFCLRQNKKRIGQLKRQRFELTYND